MDSLPTVKLTTSALTATDETSFEAYDPPVSRDAVRYIDPNHPYKVYPGEGVVVAV